jgi:hypothetical protein
MNGSRLFLLPEKGTAEQVLLDVFALKMRKLLSQTQPHVATTTGTAAYATLASVSCRAMLREKNALVRMIDASLSRLDLFHANPAQIVLVPSD